MNSYKENAFIFSEKYRIWRHVIFWFVHIIIVTLIYSNTLITKYAGWDELVILTTLWVMPFIIYAYPIMYLFIPRYLLNEKYQQFVLILIGWAGFGWFLNYLFRSSISFPLGDYLGAPRPKDLPSNQNPWASGSYFMMNMMAGFCCMIVLFKYWIKKQHEWMQAEKEKVTAELQLLKAQVHPHFLFNTLNNIYSVSLETSPKTSQLILKLSSLLNYILYECKTEHVLLEKEIKVMKDYIDLEKERYANKLEISLNIEGDIKDKYIAPLLLLPFLENAFKHGTSEQLEKPWLSMNLTVIQDTLRCKIANSKNEDIVVNENGIGIMNVKKRLALLYRNMHELEINNEGDFFVVSIVLQLRPAIDNKPFTENIKPVTETFVSNDTALSIS